MAEKAKKNINEMSFLDHLEELRWLLVRSAIAMLIGAVVCFAVSDFIFDDIIFGPTRYDFWTYQAFCELTHTIGISEICFEDFDFKIQNTSMEGQITTLVWTCIAGGFIIGFPFILWEVWKFIRPALYENERKYAKTFIFSASLLFFMGVLIGYYLILPMSIHFFSTFKVSSIVVNEFNLESYISMVKTTTIACGLFFELPIIIYLLTRLGLIGPDFLRKYRRHAIVILLIIAAIVTPPDVISQVVITIPLLIIYELSIFLSARVVKQNKLREQNP